MWRGSRKLTSSFVFICHPRSTLTEHKSRQVCCRQDWGKAAAGAAAGARGRSMLVHLAAGLLDRRNAGTMIYIPNAEPSGNA